MSCFNKSLNKVSQNEQMDLVVCFSNSLSHQVLSIYLGSVFMGKSTAVDILQKFLEWINKLDLIKLV